MAGLPNETLKNYLQPVKIVYPSEASYFAAICGILFIIFGLIGMFSFHFSNPFRHGHLSPKLLGRDKEFVLIFPASEDAKKDNFKIQFHEIARKKQGFCF